MPAKVQTYVEMANQTALSITQGPEAWMQFLRHSARFYKYSFNDQLLIYAQRPEAIACASYEIWNNTMHRYVRRGAKGIALLDPSDNGTRLRYVFDVADTGELLHSRPVEIWRLEDRHHNTVNTALDNVFSPPPMTNLRDRLKIIALESAANYLDGNLKDIVDSVAGSSLSSYDEAEIGRSFLNTAMFSISFILQARCGMEPDVTQDSLQEIAGWNTPGAVSQLGDAVAEMSKQILRQIEIAVKDYERGVEYDAAELRTERRLPDSGDGPDRAGAEALGKYGMMRRDYLEKNRPGLYTRMILGGTLMEHLQEIEETAQTRLETIMDSLKKTNGVTEDLKAKDQMTWVARMNALKIQAEEMIFSELIFA